MDVELAEAERQAQLASKRFAYAAASWPSLGAVTPYEIQTMRELLDECIRRWEIVEALRRG